jgi:rhombotail lipoprotein
MNVAAKDRWLARFVFALLLTLALFGCATTRTTHHATGVVDYLYPNTKDPVVTPGIPVLTLPARVGIAFVPSAVSPGAYRVHGSFALTEKRKMDVMQEVADHFKKYPFVKEIEIIPSPYLTPKGGFANLDQIRTMYGVNVIALVSYDQTQFTDQGVLSLAYWTIVGAYVVQGEKNDTQTMVDAVVYDIPSRKMLFRAPGTSLIKGHSTPVNLSEQLRTDSDIGFGKATEQMIANLDVQLASFREKVKARPEEFKVERTGEYVERTGGGALDAFALALLAILCGGLLCTPQRA